MLTVKDIADDLGFCTITVTRWIRSGKLKAKKKTDTEGWKIQEEDYQEFLDNNQSLIYAHEGDEGSKKYLRARKDTCTKIMMKIREAESKFDGEIHSDWYRDGFKRAMRETEQIIQDEYTKAFRGLNKTFSSY